MSKKGVIEEIFSKARFADDAKTYKIFYRDFEKLREITLPEFIKESNNFQTIPITRIERIKKNHRILFEKNTKKIE
jgi:phenylacetate-coenzyme A ligase PaaK-like adenylate-forming protein